MSASRNSFIRGFGSVLSLHGKERRRLRFTFRDRDISTLNAEEALRSDWRMVSEDLYGALSDAREEGCDEQQIACSYKR